jgi:hypothetical protein
MKMSRVLFLAAPVLGMLIAMLVVAHGGEQREQRRFYDNRGRSVGTAATDSQGTTTFRDARGNVVGKASKK